MYNLRWRSLLPFEEQSNHLLLFNTSMSGVYGIAQDVVDTAFY